MSRQLGEAFAAGPKVLAAALCRPGDRLHSLLRRYKDAPVAEARRHHVAVLARLLDDVLGRDHRAAGTTGGFDAVAAVPSSGRALVGGRLPCPVEALVAASDALRGVPAVRLGRGTSLCGHLRPSAGAYVAPSDLHGQRVLVVDDTWVTGARARSASAALENGGATAVAIAVVGRAVDPDCSPAVARWWSAVGGPPLTPLLRSRG